MVICKNKSKQNLGLKIREIIGQNKINDNVVWLKYSLGVLNALLPLLFLRRSLNFTLLSQQVWSLRIRNERTKPGYVRSRSYDPVECLAQVMQSEVYPRFLRTVSVPQVTSKSTVGLRN